MRFDAAVVLFPAGLLFRPVGGNEPEGTSEYKFRAGSTCKSSGVVTDIGEGEGGAAMGCCGVDRKAETFDVTERGSFSSSELSSLEAKSSAGSAQRARELSAPTKLSTKSLKLKEEFCPSLSELPFMSPSGPRAVAPFFRFNVSGLVNPVTGFEAAVTILVRGRLLGTPRGIQFDPVGGGWSP